MDTGTVKKYSTGTRITRPVLTLSFIKRDQ